MSATSKRSDAALARVMALVSRAETQRTLTIMETDSRRWSEVEREAMKARAVWDEIAEVARAAKGEA